MPNKDRFDSKYYRDHYTDGGERKATSKLAVRLGNFVCSYLAYLDVPVRTVLDMGCGLGLWRAPIRRHFPGARYQGVEYSEFLCRKFGWTQGSVATFRGKKPADLVICQGVLQYLEAPDAEKALANLARLTRSALYLEALTLGDWQHNVDRKHTDGETHKRSAAWYRKRLGRHFLHVGGGVWLKKDQDFVLYELER